MPRLSTALLAVAALFALTVERACAEDRIALLIGNSRYVGVAPLRNPENDVALVADSLKKAGFATHLAINAKLDDMKRELQAVVDQAAANPKSAVLIYYAGHGVQVEGENYLLPIDFKLPSEDAGAGGDEDRTIVATARRRLSIAKGAVSVSELERRLGAVQATLQIIVLDACRDDPTAPRTRGISQGLKAERPGLTGRLVAFSTAPGATAEDGANGTSTYAAAFAEALLIPGLRVDEVFARVRSKVLERTQRAQEPWQSASLDEGNFAFVPAATSEKIDEIEDLTWSLASTIGNEELLRQYLSKYPSGRFSAQAKLRIDAYNRDQTFFRRSSSYPIILSDQSLSFCKGGTEYDLPMMIAPLVKFGGERAYVSINIPLKDLLCVRTQGGELPVITELPGKGKSCGAIAIAGDEMNRRVPVACDSKTDAPKAMLRIEKTGSSIELPLEDTEDWSFRFDAAEGIVEEASLTFRGPAKISLENEEIYWHLSLAPFKPSSYGESVKFANTQERVRTSDRLQATDVAYLRYEPLPPETSKAPLPVASGEAASSAQAGARRLTSYWTHNGSLMSLTREGPLRELAYVKPRPELSAFGIGDGIMLFVGATTDGQSYEGEVFVISSNCIDKTYPVTGELSNGGKRITLTGAKPKLDASCNKVSDRPESLVFDLVGKAGSFEPSTFDLRTLATVSPLASAAPIALKRLDDDAASSFWSHNGSVVALIRKGKGRSFVYVKPREGLDRAGVARGSVFYEGATSDGRTYAGKAYAFSKQCGAASYAVSGTVSDDGKRIELRGEAPRFDGQCKPAATKIDVLAFDYLGSASTTDADEVMSGFAASKRAR